MLQPHNTNGLDFVLPGVKKKKKKFAVLKNMMSLHSLTFVWTQDTVWFDAEGAGAAEPGARGDGGDAIAGLVHTNVARVAEHHLIALLTVRL